MIFSFFFSFFFLFFFFFFFKKNPSGLCKDSKMLKPFISCYAGFEEEEDLRTTNGQNF